MDALEVELAEFESDVKRHALAHKSTDLQQSQEKKGYPSRRYRHKSGSKERDKQPVKNHVKDTQYSKERSRPTKSQPCSRRTTTHVAQQLSDTDAKRQEHTIDFASRLSQRALCECDPNRSDARVHSAKERFVSTDIGVPSAEGEAETKIRQWEGHSKTGSTCNYSTFLGASFEAIAAYPSSTVAATHRKRHAKDRLHAKRTPVSDDTKNQKTATKTRYTKEFPCSESKDALLTGVSGRTQSVTFRSEPAPQPACKNDASVRRSSRLTKEHAERNRRISISSTPQERHKSCSTGTPSKVTIPKRIHGACFQKHTAGESSMEASRKELRSRVRPSKQVRRQTNGDINPRSNGIPVSVGSDTPPTCQTKPGEGVTARRIHGACFQRHSSGKSSIDSSREEFRSSVSPSEEARRRTNVDINATSSRIPVSIDAVPPPTCQTNKNEAGKQSQEMPSQSTKCTERLIQSYRFAGSSKKRSTLATSASKSHHSPLVSKSGIRRHPHRSTKKVVSGGNGTVEAMPSACMDASLKQSAIRDLSSCLTLNGDNLEDDSDCLSTLFSDVLGILQNSHTDCQSDNREVSRIETKFSGQGNNAITLKQTAVSDIKKCLSLYGEDEQENELLVQLLPLLGESSYRKFGRSSQKTVVRQAPVYPGPGAYDVSAQLTVSSRGLRQYPYHVIDWNSLPGISRAGKRPRSFRQKSAANILSMNVGLTVPGLGSTDGEFSKVVQLFLCYEWMNTFQAMYESNYMTLDSFQDISRDVYTLYKTCYRKAVSINWFEAQRTACILFRKLEEVDHFQNGAASCLDVPHFERVLCSYIGRLCRSSNKSECVPWSYVEEVYYMLRQFWSVYRSSSAFGNHLTLPRGHHASLRRLHNTRRQIESSKGSNIALGSRKSRSKKLSGSFVNQRPEKEICSNDGTGYTGAKKEVQKIKTSYDEDKNLDIMEENDSGKSPGTRLVELLGDDSDYFFTELFDETGNLLVSAEDIQRVIRVYGRLRSYKQRSNAQTTRICRSKTTERERTDRSRQALNVEDALKYVEQRVSGGPSFAAEKKSREKTQSLLNQHKLRDLIALQSETEFLDSATNFGASREQGKGVEQFSLPKYLETLDEKRFLDIVSSVDKRDLLARLRDAASSPNPNPESLSHIPRNPAALIGALQSKESRAAESRKQEYEIQLAKRQRWYASQLHACAQGERQPSLRYGYLQGIGRQKAIGGVINPGTPCDAPDWAIAEAAGISYEEAIIWNSEDIRRLLYPRLDFGKKAPRGVRFGEEERFASDIPLAEDMENIGYLKEIDAIQSYEGDEIDLEVQNLQPPRGRVKGGRWNSSPRLSERPEDSSDEDTDACPEEKKEPWDWDSYVRNEGTRNIYMSEQHGDTLIEDDLSSDDDADIHPEGEKEPWNWDSYVRNKGTRNIYMSKELGDRGNTLIDEELSSDEDTGVRPQERKEPWNRDSYVRNKGTRNIYMSKELGDRGNTLIDEELSSDEDIGARPEQRKEAWNCDHYVRNKGTRNIYMSKEHGDTRDNLSAEDLFAYIDEAFECGSFGKHTCDKFTEFKNREVPGEFGTDLSLTQSSSYGLDRSSPHPRLFDSGDTTSRRNEESHAVDSTEVPPSHNEDEQFGHTSELVVGFQRGASTGTSHYGLEGSEDDEALFFHDSHGTEYD